MSLETHQLLIIFLAIVPTMKYDPKIQLHMKAKQSTQLIGHKMKKALQKLKIQPIIRDGHLGLAPVKAVSF